MKIWFHHLNVCSAQQPEMDRFYRDLLLMDEVPGMDTRRVGMKDYAGQTTYLTDGEVQFHMSEKDHLVGVRTGHPVNPLDRGHIAFRTDDLASFKKLLDEKGVPYSHYGQWAMGDFDQVFFFDPAGNVIEVHEVREHKARD
ncbi:MAG: VOC family protein [Flavobacteriaceae bacterium]